MPTEYTLLEGGNEGEERRAWECRHRDGTLTVVDRPMEIVSAPHAMDDSFPIPCHGTRVEHRSSLTDVRPLSSHAHGVGTRDVAGAFLLWTRR